MSLFIFMNIYIYEFIYTYEFIYMSCLYELYLNYEIKGPN